MRFRRRRKRRVCVVGLDGVPFGLLKRLTSESVMPRTAEIVSDGGLKQMRAALPPVSSVSWSSFMTGANPGEHGIFGFTDVAPESYKLRFPTFSDLAVPPFWDRLGAAGKRCAVVNQPATYPARQVPGVLISGFVAVELGKSVWPREHVPALERMGYRIDVDTRGAEADADRLLDDLLATLGTRQRATAYVWAQEDWDYFQVVVTGTDRLHHFLWQAVANTDHPRHDRVLSYYRAVDEFVGEVWDRFNEGRPASREGEGSLLLSDHGFTGVKREVRLNAWLRERGYLAYRTEEPRSVADIAPETRAFALDPGRIYLNVVGRFRQGCVAPEAAGELQGELAGRLSAMNLNGEPVIGHVFTREEAFRGPQAGLGPNLVVLGRAGFDLKGTTQGREVFAATRFQGMHTWEDALVWTSMPLQGDPEISGLAGPMVEHLLG